LKAADVDNRVRQAAAIYQALIEAELSGVIGAEPHERTPDRVTYRNGHRPKMLTTVAGDPGAADPEATSRVVLPVAAGAASAHRPGVVRGGHLHGVSTRKVDDLVRALGADTGISKTEVSRICRDLDAEVAAFRDRSLVDTAFPYVFLDATYCKRGSTAASSPKPSWWPPASPPTAAARSSASPSATVNTARFGPRSCAR
jgi:hypothetical protein